MALRNLSTEAMIALSSAWLERERPARKLLEKVPLITALVPRLEAAHAALAAYASQTNAPSLPESLEAIRDEESRIDLRHDKKARGVYLALSAYAELAESNDDAAAIVDARELLFPSGTSIVTRSYLEEAGEARLARERIVPKTRALLEALPSLEERTLADEVDAWMEAGDALGALEARRTAAEASLSESPIHTTPKAASRARTSWIRVVTAIVDNLALEEELDIELEQHVLLPLREAETRADRRAESKRSVVSSRTSHRAGKKQTAKKATTKRSR